MISFCQVHKQVRQGVPNITNILNIITRMRTLPYLLYDFHREVPYSFNKPIFFFKFCVHITTH